jgi:hypothetical protein
MKIKNLYPTGLASLPTIMALTVLILAVAIGIAAISFAENLSSFAFGQSPKALYYAETGARDALARISRNKNYSNTGGYSIDFAIGGCANHTACATVTVSNGSAPKTIVAIGKSGDFTRTLQTEVMFDGDGNGQIQSAATTEITN